jgi:hypothetical protein
LTWAAQEAQKTDRWDTALGYWREACRVEPTETNIQKHYSTCFAKLALKTNITKQLSEAAIAIDSSLKNDDEWEEGHQLQILVYGRLQQLDLLERTYDSAGESGKRWADVIRLIKHFKTVDWNDSSRPRGRFQCVWWLRGFLFCTGLCLAAAGSVRCKSSFQMHSGMAVPIFITVFGLCLSSGSALLDWTKPPKTEKKKKATTPS